MKRARLAGVALIAIFAMSLIVASAASAAAPEFKPASGTFKATAGTSTLSGGGNEVTCTASSATGEITGAKTVGKVLVKFTGCKGASGCSVNSKAGATGEIATVTLNGALGLILAGHFTSDVGEDLSPATGKEFTNILGTCVPTTKVLGSIAGEASPIGKSSKTGKLVFAATSGKQNISKIDLSSGSVEPELEAFSAVATESTSDEVTFNTATEIT